MSATEAVVPTSLDEISPEWLTAVLRTVGACPPDATVDSVAHERIALGTGFTSNLYRSHLTISGTGPSSVIVKLPSDAEQFRQLGVGTGMYSREVDYYQAVASAVPLRAPRSYFANRGEETGAFVLVLEDLQNLDAADHLQGLSIERAERVVEEIAGLHAWSMGPGRALLEALSFPAEDDPLLHALPPIAFSVGWDTYVANARHPLPPAFEGLNARLSAALPRVLEALAEPRGLLHGDLRADNLFFDDAGLPTVVDYQLSRWGAGMTDVAYLMSQGLRTDDRRGHDQRLLDVYQKALVDHGAPTLDDELLWQQYRLATLMQIIYPLAAMMGWSDLPDRARDLCLTLVERAIATAIDINAVHALDQLAAI